MAVGEARRPGLTVPVGPWTIWARPLDWSRAGDGPWGLLPDGRWRRRGLERVGGPGAGALALRRGSRPKPASLLPLGFAERKAAAASGAHGFGTQPVPPGLLRFVA
jgi:hypothetical protein